MSKRTNISEMRPIVKAFIRTYPGAPDALDRMLKKGVPEGELLDWLAIIQISKGLHRDLRTERRRSRARRASRSRRISRLAQHLRTTADEIRVLNADLFPAEEETDARTLTEKIAAWMKEGYGQTLESQFQSLPYALCTYAMYVEQLTARMTRLGAGSTKGTMTHPRRSVERLVDKYKRPRSKHFFIYLATLLQAIGYSEDKPVDAETLRKYHQRKTRSRS